MEHSDGCGRVVRLCWLGRIIMPPACDTRCSARCCMVVKTSNPACGLPRTRQDRPSLVLESRQLAQGFYVRAGLAKGRRPRAKCLELLVPTQGPKEPNRNLSNTVAFLDHWLSSCIKGGSLKKKRKTTNVLGWSWLGIKLASGDPHRSLKLWSVNYAEKNKKLIKSTSFLRGFPTLRSGRHRSLKSTQNINDVFPKRSPLEFMIRLFYAKMW